MTLPRRPPQWATSLTNVGRDMASLPSTSVGDRAPRLLLSVPTGQYVTWLIANGAFQAPPKLGPEPSIGDKVAVWLDMQMQDVHVEQESQTKWIVKGGSSRQGTIGIERIPGVKVPIGTPADRGQGKPTNEYRQRLSELPGMKTNYANYYQQQCYSPVVIIGDGAEYLHKQRDELINDVPNWLDEHSRLLMDQDTLQVTRAERILFHPFMILSPKVGTFNPWIRTISPRLVIVTRWSYFERMDPALFASSPVVILANRRVTTNWNAIDATSELDELASDFKKIEFLDLPNGIFARKFTSRVDLPFDDEDEWEN